MEIRFNRQFLITILLTIVCLYHGLGLADTVNYCHDEAVNKDWEKLVHNTTEPEVKELYRLRKELCRKVDSGIMELDTAIDIFETERLNKIEAIKRRKLQTEEPFKSAG